MIRRALVTGFFSTFGDMESLDVVSGWLQESNVTYDVAAYSQQVRAETGFLDPRLVEAKDYTHLIVVCGPYSPHHYRRIGLDLNRFVHCTRIGINLEIIDEGERLPFDVLFARSMHSYGSPDITFLHEAGRQPVVGVLLAPHQREYGQMQGHNVANSAIQLALSSMSVATINLDTRFPPSRNTSGIRSSIGFESICSRLDAIVTTRLHGLVLGIKNGVPVVALDPIYGGAKVSRQAQQLEWPVLHVDECSAGDIKSAVAWALSEPARSKARATRDAAELQLSSYRDAFFFQLDERPLGIRVNRSIATLVWTIARVAVSVWNKVCGARPHRSGGRREA